jgi:hypothetical protein
MMSAASTLPLFAEELTCSAAASPASRLASPAKGLAQPTLAPSGRKCVGLFENAGRASSWVKTFAACLVTQGAWHSKVCVLTWKLKATTSSRFYFQLRALVPPTTATGSGLWPTPDAALATGGKTLNREVSLTGRTPDGKKRQVSINDYAKRGLLPAPTASTGGSNNNSAAVLERGHGTNLIGAVKRLLPTPVAADAIRSSPTYAGGNLTLRGALLPTPTVNGNHNRAGLSPTSGDGLSTAVKKVAQPGGGSLNPRFVAEMMGFPPDWCDL